MNNWEEWDEVESELNEDEGFLNFNGELTDDNIVNYGRVEVDNQYSVDSVFVK